MRTKINVFQYFFQHSYQYSRVNTPNTGEEDVEPVGDGEHSKREPENCLFYNVNQIKSNPNATNIKLDTKTTAVPFGLDIPHTKSFGFPYPHSRSISVFAPFMDSDKKFIHRAPCNTLNVWTVLGSIQKVSPLLTTKLSFNPLSK